MPMQSEKKALLVTVLRSNRFKQGRNQLRNSADEYCPLGVLCELSVEDGADVVVDQTTEGDYRYDGEIAFLPDAVVEWAGLNFDSPAVLCGKARMSLAYLFDGTEGIEDADLPAREPLDFAQIADLIEADTEF